MFKNPALLTPVQVARMLSVRDSKVLKWCRSGELPAINLAESQSKLPRYKIRPEAVEQFLTARTMKPVAPPVRTRHRQGKAVTKFY